MCHAHAVDLGEHVIRQRHLQVEVHLSIEPVREWTLRERIREIVLDTNMWNTLRDQLPNGLRTERRQLRDRALAVGAVCEAEKAFRTIEAIPELASGEFREQR